jgi:hypothetical protein
VVVALPLARASWRCQQESEHHEQRSRLVCGQQRCNAGERTMCLGQPRPVARRRPRCLPAQRDDIESQERAEERRHGPAAICLQPRASRRMLAAPARQGAGVEGVYAAAGAGELHLRRPPRCPACGSSCRSTPSRSTRPCWWRRASFTFYFNKPDQIMHHLFASSCSLNRESTRSLAHRLRLLAVGFYVQVRCAALHTHTHLASRITACAL